MMRFQYEGHIPASKSFFNRALIVKSFFPELKVQGESNCDDVRVMQAALNSLQEGTEIDCGEAGAVIRFMALRASRESGTFLLKGSPRLMARPQQELVDLLPQLGVQIQSRPGGFLITSQGWKKPEKPILVRANESSQFLSGLLLSAWDLPFALEFKVDGPRVSNAYWEMTLRFCQGLGMKIQIDGSQFIVAPEQTPTVRLLHVEPDFSSAFPLAVAGALWGETRFLNMSTQSLQPDSVFPQLLEKCGAQVATESQSLIIRKAGSLRGAEHHLLQTPDLFPVLAVMAAFSEGESRLTGAPQIVAKESDRLQKTAELLKLAGVPFQVQGIELTVQGQGPQYVPSTFEFDPDYDHRMAMAAGLLKLRNFKIQISKPEVVTKSFPGFWNALGQGSRMVLP